MKLSINLILAGTLALLASVASAAPYPDKPIRFVVPYTPGSGPDIVARTLSNVISPRIGQAFVVDNKPGANGTIGIGDIAKAAPDGYTLGLVVNSFSMNPSLYKNVPDPVKAFDPLGLVARGSMVLVSRPSLGVGDLKSLVALSKSKPHGLTYATPGIGSPQHLATALLGQATGANLMNVPYRGSGPAVTAVLAGEVDLMFMPVHTAVPMIKAGKLKPLMVSTAKRSARLPEVPTGVEMGVKDFDVDLWYAVVAPLGTAAEPLARMRSEVQVALKDPSVVSSFADQGLEPVFVPAAGFTELLRADVARWAAVIRHAGIEVE